MRNALSWLPIIAALKCTCAELICFFTRFRISSLPVNVSVNCKTKSDGSSNDAFFSFLKKEDILPNQQLKGNSFVSLFKKNSFKNYITSPTKDAVFVYPALGVNSYDKLMLGALVTNYKLPPSKFQFLLAPLYGTGSKKNEWVRQNQLFHFFKQKNQGCRILFKWFCFLHEWI